jgi:hypothetical protein
MGAHSFTIVSKETDPKAAYAALVAEARSDYGSDAYNGTISTTRGFRVVSGTPLSESAAATTVESRIAALSKWDVCEAVAVGKAIKTKKRTVTITLRPTGDATSDMRLSGADVASHLGIPVASLEDFTVVASIPKYRYVAGKPGPARRAWTTSMGGEFGSRTEAVAFARQKLEERAWHDAGVYVSGDEAIEVFQRTLRSPEASVQRKLISWKIKLTVDVASNDEKVFDHWLFYGWAAS